jgi:hypothetical protein
MLEAVAVCESGLELIETGRGLGHVDQSPCLDLLLWRDERIGGWNFLLRFRGTGGSLRPLLSLLLAFLEFGELLLTLLESVVALGHMAFRHGTGRPDLTERRG